MSIAATCGCGKQYSLADQFAGKKVKCKACGQAFVVPAATAVVAAPPKPAQAKAAPAAIAPAKAPAPEPLALKDDAGLIGLAPDPDEKQKAPKPAPIKPSSTRTASMKAIDSAPPLQAEAPVKAQPAPAKPGKHDAAWESMLNQQNAALREAESKQSAANAKRAAEEKAAAMMRAKEAERVANSAKRSSSSSDNSERTSSGFFADWMAEPFDSWLSIPVAFAISLVIVTPLALINGGLGTIVSIIFMVIGGIIAFIANIRSLVAVYNNSPFIGVMLFVPMVNAFVGIYALVAYWHDTRGPFIMGMVGSGLMFGAMIGGAFVYVGS